MQTICVDIGNSGMRCVRVLDTPTPEAPTPDAPTPDAQRNCPWSAELLRVDWQAVRQDGTLVPAAMFGALDRWLTQVSLDPTSPCRWLVSSVQRQMEEHLRHYVLQRPADLLHMISHRELPLEVRVDAPERVGIDRLLAASAAEAEYPAEPLIVVQAGSAITVDWIEPPRCYCGGAIMPGVPMMLRLLSQAADLLPEVAADELLQLPPLPGRNTQAAMRAGVSSAVVGGVRHLIERYRTHAGQPVRVVLSGGDGPLLSPHLSPPWVVVDHLVLRGLVGLNNMRQW